MAFCRSIPGTETKTDKKMKKKGEKEAKKRKDAVE